MSRAHPFLMLFKCVTKPSWLSCKFRTIGIHYCSRTLPTPIECMQISISVFEVVAKDQTLSVSLCQRASSQHQFTVEWCVALSCSGSNHITTLMLERGRSTIQSLSEQVSCSHWWEESICLIHMLRKPKQIKYQCVLAFRLICSDVGSSQICSSDRNNFCFCRESIVGTPFWFSLDYQLICIIAVGA